MGNLDREGGGSILIEDGFFSSRETTKQLHFLLLSSSTNVAQG